MRTLLGSTVLINYLRALLAVKRGNTLVAGGATLWMSAVNVVAIFRAVHTTEFASCRLNASRAGNRVNGGASSRGKGAQADWLIAAAAHAVVAVLATDDPRHFPIGGIEIQHWPVAQQYLLGT